MHYSLGESRANYNFSVKLFTDQTIDAVVKTQRPKEERIQSPREEIANSVSAALGLIAILAGVPLLLSAAIGRGSEWSLVGAIIFAISMIVSYLTSTIYHALPRNSVKRLFRLFDHSAIFLLIAGTYTPFALGVLRGPWGWSLFVIVWTLAFLGIGFKTYGGFKYRRLSTWLYIALGWAGLFAVRPFLLHVPLEGGLWILAGGIAYTVGVIFYALKRIPYHHLIWHLWVFAGTVCHFCAVLWYAG
jgi:hemolysin III